jgi:acetylornithine deacetylase
MTPARDILIHLVSFPTVSRDSNLPLIDWVEGYLTSLGITAHRMPKADDPGKHALFCSVGPNVPGGIVLSGHTDVVPIDGQDWTSDPWTVTERDGKLYGRGTCDMKGFDALALHTLQRALTCDLKRPLQVALSFDEEVGCMGAPPLIEAMKEAGFAPAEAAIVGEPSMMACVTGHKGIECLGFHFKGAAVHSSLMHTGVSAVMEAAHFIDWVNQQNAASMADAPSDIAAVFDPPWTTQHVGQIDGGTAQNITATDCHFSLEIRLVPDEQPAHRLELARAKAAEIDARMRHVVPSAGIDIIQRESVPGLVPEKDGAAERLVRRLTGDNANHVVSYGTEAGHFQAAGISTVVCGPGDIAQAHQPDEFISIAQFEAGEAFLAKVVDSLCD